MTTDATKRWVTAALMAVAVSISVAPAACVAEQTEAPLAMGVPDATWPAIYFEPVDRLTEAAGLKPLREARPRAGVTELRVWVGFGLQSLRGLRLRREGEQWSGQHLTARYVPTEPNRPARRSDPLKASAEPVRPASGWDHLWRELDRLGVRTLPDGGTVYDNRTRDGVGYLFEVLTPDGYRAYLYSNPDQSRVKEAVAVAKIMFLLTRELGVESLYHPPTAFHQYVSDGQVVLLRRGDAYGAFRLVDQRAANHLRGEKHDRAEVHWIYRRDGRSKAGPRRPRRAAGQERHRARRGGAGGRQLRPVPHPLVCSHQR